MRPKPHAQPTQRNPEHPQKTVYYPGDRSGGDGGDTGLAADDPLAAELIYGGLQDAKTLRRWRELLWFYTEWQKKRGA